MNPKLKDAVAIFKELGWDKVTAENILDLPTGTPEQRQQALEGLKSGQLGDFVVEGRVHRWKAHFNVSVDKLILFAIRIGVTPARAKTILTSVWDQKLNEAKIKIIISRGEKFASALVTAWYGNSGRGMFSDIPFRLVHEMELKVPQLSGYVEDWAWLVDEAFHLNPIRWVDPNRKQLSQPLIEKRFGEHIQAGFAANTPLTGNFGRAAVYGAKQGLVSRDEMVPLTFSALDAAIRPADRKATLEILDEMQITHEEIADRVQSIIPILATSDSIVINYFAPPLIAHAPGDMLVEVMVSSFSATTKKTRLLVLKSALARKCPPNPEEIAPWLSILAADKDKTIITAATKLMKAWAIENDPAQEDEEAAIQGLWQDTPPLWEVPLFEIGEITQDNLIDSLAKVYERQDQATTHDIAVERLLAIAVAQAYKNPEDVRVALAGIKGDAWWWDGLLLHHLKAWSKGENLVKPGWSSRQPIEYRDRFAAMNLGKLPCLLSTPSKVDLTISVTDLAQRLAIYNKQGIPALDSDLFIALTRLDVETKTPEAIKQLKSMKVDVKKPNEGLLRKVMIAVNACDLVLKYIEDPSVEPEGGKIPKSLAIFNRHLPENGVFSMFPLWGDAALRCVSWDNGYHNQTKGHILRQVARRRNPLPPGGAMNMIAAQRSSSPQTQADTALALANAWERGLLRPGVADIKLLDWQEKGPPTNLGALAAVMEGMALGGMLSVIWPILDELILLSLKEPRLLSGTAELSGLVGDFLPEVLHAIKEGKANETALDLPGISKLAQHGGTSKAVTAAKAVVAQLPNLQGQEESVLQKPVIKAEHEMKEPFDKVWPKPDTEANVVEDGVDIKISTTGKGKDFIFTLVLPSAPDKPLNITNIWPYDIENSGICTANYADPATSGPDYRAPVFLGWDQQTQALVTHSKRESNKRRGASPPRLSLSILTIILASLAQDGGSYNYSVSLNLVKNLAKRQGIARKDGQINPHAAKKAMEVILQNPVVSPGKLVRCIEKEITLLPVLWPMLTEAVRFGGEMVASGEKLPLWVNRVLDVCLLYAPYLLEAGKRGFIPGGAWDGLGKIADRAGKSTAVGKACVLAEVLG
ncbi:MAG: hypothetical protein FWE42_08695 [Defluviitaleaceae bacterium]|nr:hypothetical protein [Defluviitaleaceae bacterium]